MGGINERFSVTKLEDLSRKVNLFFNTQMWYIPVRMELFDIKHSITIGLLIPDKRGEKTLILYLVLRFL